jgi:hypothetical protein
MKSTNSNRSSSVQSAPAWRMNTAVSVTVIGRIRIDAMYANGAHFQDGATAAIASGLCETVLITHGESGRSGVGRTRNVVAPTSLAGQFEQPYGPTWFTIPILRYMKTYGLTHEQLAMVSVVQREWAAKNLRATFKTPITVEDVLNSRMIAYLVRLLPCCLMTARRRPDPDFGRAHPRLPAKLAPGSEQGPVYLLGTGESVETPMVASPVTPAKAGIQSRKGIGRPPGPPLLRGDESSISSRAFRIAGPRPCRSGRARS